jgi:hypothetical protein
MRLLGSTWLALNVLVAEHGTLIAAAAVCLVQPARTRWRQAA